MIRPKAENFFWDFVSKSFGQRCENALEAWFFAYFVSVIPQNFRTCGAAILPHMFFSDQESVYKVYFPMVKCKKLPAARRNFV